MKMYCLTNEKDVSGDDPISLTLEQAFMELDKFPSSEEYKGPEGGPFIGFVNQNQEIIQFGSRGREDDNWMIDIPVFHKNKFIFTINFTLNTEEVKNVIEKFFADSTNYDAFLNTNRNLPAVDEEIENINSLEFGISYNVVKNYFFLATDENEVLAEIHIEDKKMANEFLSKIKKQYSVRLISVKEILDTLN